MPLTLVDFPAFPDEQKHRRQATLHKQVCPQEEKWLPNLQPSLFGEEEMGPKRSPSSEMLVGTSLAGLPGVLTLRTTALLGHRISSPLPSPSPLRFRTGLFLQTGRRTWLSSGSPRTTAGGSLGQQRAAQPRPFGCRLSFEERDGKVPVSAGRNAAGKETQKVANDKAKRWPWPDDAAKPI